MVEARQGQTATDRITNERSRYLEMLITLRSYVELCRSSRELRENIWELLKVKKVMEKRNVRERTSFVEAEVEMPKTVNNEPAECQSRKLSAADGRVVYVLLETHRGSSSE